MKILQIGLSYNPGGIESCIMDYYRELSKRNIRFDFICMYESLAYEDEIEVLGGKIFYITNVKKSMCKYAKELKAIIQEEQYDAVHVNMLSAANILPLIVANQAGVKKIIAHSHNSATPGLHRKILHKINKPLIDKYATNLVACSEMAAKWLFIRRELKKVIIIRNAVDLDEFLFNKEKRIAKRIELGIQDYFTLVHIGRFEEQKNHMFLVEVFKEVVEAASNTRLLLIGEGGNKREIEKRVNHLGVADKVWFMGVRHDISEILMAADVFVFPSLFEGLPVVAIEAQASGVYAFLADTITDEVALTDKVRFLSLESGAKEWGKQILLVNGIKRDEKENVQICEAFEESGYKISVAAEKLLSLYEEGLCRE
ncbi:glycosyltransferase involved in cell wall biosynthesis [Lachnospiraceae bacterium PF1-22]|uniref:glycosyltransferase family 1 protein n=1 Tax=Ohessyouella blattaphilus TaxID=2949333 RepID=UPI003E22E238